jgi:hypothetical protein
MRLLKFLDLKLMNWRVVLIKQKQIFLMAILIFSAAPVYAGIRCLDDIISEGDTNYEVMLKLEKCGEFISKDVIRKEISFDQDKNIEKEIPVEQWHIKVLEQGGTFCYPLDFQEGVLKEIGKWTKCE